MLTVGSLFAGIGGFDLGLERAGMSVKWQVEIDPYCLKVLEKHYPHVKRYTDIKTVRWEDVEPVDLICGGFPCQDLSVAGKQAGIDGERSGLWSEYARCLRALRPRYVIVENVPGLLANTAMGRVLGDLASIGYDAEWTVLSAADVGAPHLRKRVWIVAYPGGRGCGGSGGVQGRGQDQETVGEASGAAVSAGPCSDVADSKIRRLQGGDETIGLHSVESGNGESESTRGDPGISPSGADVSDAAGERSQGHRQEYGLRETGKEVQTGRPSDVADSHDTQAARQREHSREIYAEPKPAGLDGGGGEGGWTTECRLGRGADGVPCGLDNCGGWECGLPRLAAKQAHRVHRLKALGNAVVPQVVKVIGDLIRRYAEEEVS